MSLELTPEGEQAYRILRWAQEDPAGRAVQAVRQVGDLARPLLGSSSQALRDVQDAGTVLARLADSVTAGVSGGEVPLTSGNTISGAFLSGDLSTISGQVDLGWEAALHPRDNRGRFARTPGGALPWSVTGDQVKYAGSLDIPREQTPQFSGVIGGRYNPPEEVIPRFTAWMAARGITMTPRRVPSGELKPIKASGSWKAVRGIADELKSGKRQDTKQLIVSSDGYVVDGTQTWAARRLADAEGGRPGLAPGVPVLQASVPVHELLDRAGQFMAEIGMPTRKAGEIADPAYIHGPTISAQVQAVPAGRDSLAKYTRPDGTLDPLRAALHQQIIGGILDGHQPQAHPVATFFGGGPAAGKSSALKATPDDTAHVDPDEIKGQLPEYQVMKAAGDPRAAAYVHEESSLLSKQAMAEAQKRKVNFTLDGTGDSDIAKLAGKVNAARAAGYATEGKYVTISTDEAVRRAKARAADPADSSYRRHVPETFIRETHAAVSDTFAKAVALGLYDEAELWDNTTRTPRLIAGKEPGGAFTVHDPGAWQAFLDKAKE